MSAELMPFTYANTTVRVVMIDGTPWFVLNDLCVVLEIANVGNVADRLDQLNIRRADVENARGQMRQTVVVNESGMYEVVIRSDKPAAVTFRRWITGEVLPTIRKTGSYNTAPALTDDELIHRALEVSARRVNELTEKVAALAPSAAAWDELAEAGADYEVADAAKVLSRDPNIRIGRDRLFAYMAGLDWVYRGHRARWRAYQSQVDLGRLAEKVGKPYWCPDLLKLVTPEPTVRITSKGLAELYKRLGGGTQLALVATS